MEVPSYMGTEKYQMLELNKRLETYLGRVKFLEEENKLLHGEVEALRQSKNQRVWKGQLEGELRKTREEVEAALREKDRVELEVSNLNEELQMLQLQRKKVAVARAETKKTVDESKKQLEEEHRGQIWLREKLAQLEKELQFHMEVHQEDVSLLQTQIIHTQYVPPHTYVQPQLLGLEDIKQEFSQRAARAWQEAAGSFQNQVQRLEDSLTQAKSRMAQVSQEKKESYLMAQCLAKELEAAQAKKELLEKNVSQQKDRQLKELQHLEVHLEALESEKAELSNQTAAILKDRHNLLQLKLSLGLEVATYRTLLDSESLRPRVSPKIYYQSASTSREVPKHQTIKQSLTPTISVKPGRRSEMTAPTMAPASLQAPKVNPNEKSIRSEMTNNEEDGWCAESPGSPGWSTHYSKADVIDSSLSGDVRAVEADEGEDHAYALSEQMAQELRATVISLDTSVTETSAIRETHIKEMEEECNLEIAGLEKNLTKQPSLAGEELDQDSKNTLKCLTVTPQFAVDIKGLLSSEQTLDVSEKENPDALKADQLEDNFSDRPVEEVSEMTEKYLPVEAVDESLLVWGEKQVGSEEVNGMESMTSGSKSEPESERELELETIPNETDSFGFEALVSNQSNSAELMLDEKTAEESQSSMTEVKGMQFSEEISLNHRQTTTSYEESKDNVGSMAHQQVDELTLEECRTCELKGCVRKLEEENAGDVAEQTCDNGERDEEKIDGVMEVGEENQSFHTSTLIFECPRVEKTNEQQVHLFTNAEQQEFSDNDDVSNATNSWRTGGDLDSTDSYALENTLADTRPLIRYRSDETDMNTQASHLGETDSSEDEEQESGAGIFEKEKRYSLGSRGDRMIEDLIEEPEWEEIQKSENAGCFNNRETDTSQIEEDDGHGIDKIEEKEIHFEGNVGCLESDGKSVLEIDRKAMLSEENIDLDQAEQDRALGNKAYDQTNLNKDMGDHVDGIVSTGSTDTKADLEKYCYDKATPLSSMEVDSNFLPQETDSTDIKADLEKDGEDDPTTQINWEVDSNFLPQATDSTDIKADLDKDSEDDPTTQINLEVDSNFLPQATDSTDIKADLEKDSEDDPTTQINLEMDSNFLPQATDSTDIKADLEKDSEDDPTTQINLEVDSNFLPQATDSTDIKADLEKDSEDDPTTQINWEMDSNFLPQATDSTDIKADLEKDSEDDPTTQINWEVDTNFLPQATDLTDIKADLEKDSEDDPTTQINWEVDTNFLPQATDSTDIKADLEKDSEDDPTTQINLEVDTNFLPQATDSIDIKADLEKDSEDDPTTQINWEVDTNFLPQATDSIDIKADLEKDSEDDPTTQINLEVDTNFLPQATDSTDIKADLEKDSEDDPTTQINWEVDTNFLPQETDSTDIKADLEKDSEDDPTTQINWEVDSNFLPQPTDSTDIKADLEKDSEDDPTTQINWEVDTNFLPQETDSTDIKADLEKDSEDDPTTQINLEMDSNFLPQATDSTDIKADLEKDSEDDPTTQINLEMDSNFLPQATDSTDIKADLEKDSEDDPTTQINLEAESKFLPQETDSTDIKADLEKDSEDDPTTQINLEADSNFLPQQGTIECEEFMEPKSHASCDSETNLVNPVNINSEESSGNLSDNEEGIRKESFVENFTISSYGQSPSTENDNTSEILHSQTVTSDEGSEKVLKSEVTEMRPEQKEEDGENSSMLTNVDFNDDLSLHSEITSIAEVLEHTAISDLEDSYSSEDDSPNASQSLKSINQEDISENHKEKETMTCSVNDSGLIGGTEKHFPKLSSTSIENAWGSSDHIQDDKRGILGTDLKASDQFIQSDENIKEYFSYTEQKYGESKASEQQNGNDHDSETKEDEIFTAEVEGLPRIHEKCTELFSATLNEEFWNSNGKMGAFFHPQECGNSECVHTHPNQNAENTENMLETKQCTELRLKEAQSHGLPVQEQIPAHIEQLLYENMERDKKHSEESLEEEDSWSGGED
ncbi:nestin isoform X9 [Brienomyrus brachyistius]|uniref:nestin isoform X9 n=1 Tax=Brienomyrus brachyistius TaxID=42636 RepID=UPI0020B27A07|nr:nestin isoform X9 [Brienomyrus brachyistius]